MSSYFYNLLDAQEKAEYDKLLLAIKSAQKTVSCKKTKHFRMMINDIRDNYPELFWLSHRMKSEVLGNKLTFIYIYSARHIQSLKSELKQTTESIIQNIITGSQSEYDKVLVIHDYLKKQIQYGTEQGRIGTNKVDESAHNIVGALIRKKSVCEGIAKAMKYLCDIVGVECHVVSGIGTNSLGTEPHAWNIVKINGYYHHVDVTWDLQFSEEDVPMYAYLNLNDDEIKKDHTWDKSIYPDCPEDPYNYFKMNRAMISSKAQLVGFLVDALSLEETNILFKVEKGSVLEMEIMGCLGDCIDEAMQKCKYNNVNSWRYIYVQEQLVFSITIEYEGVDLT